jgi:hypothetical protein
LTIQEFITERAKGAAKIAADAKAKGGVALLTYQHFAAKAPSYKACMVLVSAQKPPAAILDDLKKLEHQASTTAMTAASMIVFQQQTGKQEVYGECIQFLENGGPGVSVEAKAHRPDEVVKTFEITAPKDVMERFEKFLSHVQHCAGVGHSTNVGMSIDGDGPDYFYVEPEPPEIDHDLSDKEQRVEIP